MSSEIDMSLSKPEQIKELRIQIDEVRSEIALLDKSFGETDDFRRFLAAKTGTACSAISEAVKAEEEETDRQIELLKASHKEKLARIDSEIEVVKAKARKLLTGIEAEMEKGQVPAPAPAPAPAPVPAPAPAPAPDPAPVPLPESLKVSEARYDEASDDEIELLVKELKARKLRKMGIEEDISVKLEQAPVQELPVTKTEPEQKPEEKVIEGFWENDEDIADTAAAKDSVDTGAEETEASAESASKHAFILGKFAGDNLFDESGKLIIAKDEVITEEVIAKAESEEKLVDLIVDMKFS